MWGLAYKTLIPCNLYGRWDHYGDLERSHLMAAIVTKVEEALRTGQQDITTGEQVRLDGNFSTPPILLIASSDRLTTSTGFRIP